MQREKTTKKSISVAPYRVCVCMFACANVYVYLCVYVHACVNAYVSTCVHVYMCVCVCVHMCESVSFCSLRAALVSVLTWVSCSSRRLSMQAVFRSVELSREPRRSEPGVSSGATSGPSLLALIVVLHHALDVEQFVSQLATLHLLRPVFGRLRRSRDTPDE